MHSTTKYPQWTLRHRRRRCGCRGQCRFAWSSGISSKRGRSIQGPFDSFLALRGVKTLALRMERQSPSAAAHWLAKASADACTTRRGMWRSQAARLARKCPSAFFPSLAASAMLSKKTASALLAPTYRHNKFPTATAFGDSLASSRRTNSRLGQILHSCIIRWRWSSKFSN
jgi:hypothetical protein